MEKHFEKAQVLDQNDTLATYKDEFYIKDGEYYLDGNSLGLLSKRAEASVHRSLEDWKLHGIDGWTEGKEPWYYLSEKLGELSAPLVGAKPSEVTITGSTTINLHQLVSTFYKPEAGKTKLIADELNFPSDIYALQSQVRLHGLDPEIDLVRVKSRDGRTIHEEDVIAAMDDETALIVLPSVLYRSGQLLNIGQLTEEAHKRGILIGFDLAHSIGSVPHRLHEDGVDFAFWCTYKHLNGGPGSVGGLYVHERHHDVLPGLTGWFGSDKTKQFDMEHTYTPSGNAGAFQIGTPHILSMAPLVGSLEMFNEIGMAQIREKSLRLTEFMMEMVEEELGAYGFEIGNPVADEQRGGHVCLEHSEAARICKALKEAGVVPDFRAPNVVRLAPVALYTSFEDVYESIKILKAIMDDETYKNFANERNVIA